MRHSTTNTYQLKREILGLSKRLSEGTHKDQQKFTGDMLYGVLASGSCILSRMADCLKEDIHKKNTVERLSRKLTENIPEEINEHYLTLMQGISAKDSPIFVDDSDVVKPYGKSFEALGLVRDGSALTPTIQKGYHVTEITALSERTRQPFSLFSLIHSSHAKEYVSVNDITFKALKKTMSRFPKSTYIFDRGYDMNSLFGFMKRNHAQFIVRLTEKRKLFHKGKWLKATTLRDSHKGKLKSHVMFNGKKTECWFTCVNAQITESRTNLKLVLVYGLSHTPMMLATNRPIKSKEDVISVARLYFMRWRIEEYFRFKKQHLGFEGFRIRSLKAMNALNQYLSYAIGILCFLAEKRRSSTLRMAVLCSANSQKEEEKVSFLLYRIGLGVCRILAQACTGIREWFHIGRSKFHQLEFPLLC